MALATALALGGLALGAGSSFLSSKSANKSATKAANIAQQTSDSTNALAANIYNSNQGHLQPFINRGDQAGGALQSMLGFGDQEQGRGLFRNYLQNSDYGFQFGEGANQVNSGYAGAGTLQSGAAMRALEDYRQNLQSGYRGEFNNLLSNQQAVGLGAGSALAGVGQNYVNTVGNNNQYAGEAAANAALYKGANNPLANAIGMVGGGLYGMNGMKF